VPAQVSIVSPSLKLKARYSDDHQVQLRRSRRRILTMASQLREFLEDAFLARLYREVRHAGPIRAISVDLTHRCNLRGVGCYFFAEGMDLREAPRADAAFEAFLARKHARGTTFVTVIGGKPSLVLDRLRALAGTFRTTG
jgi:hypothetical protein